MKRKGFTLIELLIVIAILGVLAAAVIMGINPAKRIRQANDTKIKNDVGQLATALQSYTTLKEGLYPVADATWQTQLVSNGDLKTEFVGGGGTCTSYTYLRSATCTTASCEAAVYCTLNDPTTIGLNVYNTWCWTSGTGKACQSTAVSCTAGGTQVCLP